MHFLSFFVINFRIRSIVTIYEGQSKRLPTYRGRYSIFLHRTKDFLLS